MNDIYTQFQTKLRSYTTKMKFYQQNEKDVSKVFTFVREQLQVKENQLLELQRKNPCLLAPDSEQVDTLVGAIGALQLSTPDGSFVFTSISDDEDVETSRITSVCSADFNSIKTLPSNVWLAQPSSVKRRPSICGHLLSLPIDAYLASSRRSTYQTPTVTESQVNHEKHIADHLLSMPLSAFKPASSRPFVFQTPTTTQSQVNHMANHLLSMPLSAFKPSSTTSTPVEITNDKYLQNSSSSTTEGTSKSLVSSGSPFSKELWLQNDDLPTTEQKSKSLVSAGSMFSKELWLQNH